MNGFTDGLFEFLARAKTAYHTVAAITEKLVSKGFKELSEADKWELSAGEKYFVVRDGSSVIAWVNNRGPFMVSASHSDSPAFLVKASSESAGAVRLDTERYGGMINYTWMDRPLTVAGRVVLRTETGLSVRLADIGDVCVVIPSLAPHLNRSVNDGVKLDPKTDLIPILSSSSVDIIDMIADNLGVGKEQILSHELYLTSAEKPRAVGASGELVLSPRLDDLACVYASLTGFIAQETRADVCPVLAVFNNEEVGSETKQGAASSFLIDTLSRIAGEDYPTRIPASFMLSADNAHACHPNHPEMSDKANAPRLSGGIVIKHNANQRYATDAVSEAVFRTVCEREGIRLQSYFNRPDLPGGSTLGSIASAKVPLRTVDIGIPQLAMHSACELCAISDAWDMARAMRAFYNSRITLTADGLKMN